MTDTEYLNLVNAIRAAEEKATSPHACPADRQTYYDLRRELEAERKRRQDEINNLKLGRKHA